MQDARCGVSGAERGVRGAGGQERLARVCGVHDGPLEVEGRE